MRYVKHNEAELLREISCSFYDRGPALGIGSASDREVLCLLRPVCPDCPEPGTDHKQDFLSNRAAGYASSSAGPVHFGLGTAATVTEIEIQWPSGTRQVLQDVAAGRLVRIKEGR